MSVVTLDQLKQYLNQHFKDESAISIRFELTMLEEKELCKCIIELKNRTVHVESTRLHSTMKEAEEEAIQEAWKIVQGDVFPSLPPAQPGTVYKITNPPAFVVNGQLLPYVKDLVIWEKDDKKEKEEGEEEKEEKEEGNLLLDTAYEEEEEEEEEKKEKEKVNGSNKKTKKRTRKRLVVLIDLDSADPTLVKKYAENVADRLIFEGYKFDQPSFPYSQKQNVAFNVVQLNTFLFSKSTVRTEDAIGMCMVSEVGRILHGTKKSVVLISPSPAVSLFCLLGNNPILPPQQQNNKKRIYHFFSFDEFRKASHLVVPREQTNKNNKKNLITPSKKISWN